MLEIFTSAFNFQLFLFWLLPFYSNADLYIFTSERVPGVCFCNFIVLITPQIPLAPKQDKSSDVELSFGDRK